MGHDRDAARLVSDYLAAMEARQLERAAAMLAPGFVMRFPDTGPMTDLAELMAWAAPRYRRVGKTIEATEVVPGSPPVVWTRGWLHGEWPDGAPFERVRFVDRFELAGGLIARQDVWNDLDAAMRARAA
jgi:hypothetical protein